MADQISDAILDALLAKDPLSRVACETLLTTGLCLITGEITTDTWVDIPDIARKTINDIGYNRDDLRFNGDACGVMVCIGEQSEDIALGVDRKGAGDQGMMFGYACQETEDYMPLPIDLAHKLARLLSEVRKLGVIPYLRPDGKVQVSVNYEGNEPTSISKILISTQHDPGINRDRTTKPDLIEYVIRPVLGDEFPIKEDQVLVNPTGVFVLGGPYADAGLTGRKIIVDTYGGMARHGGGAFSGKDPSKVDRSAAYAARWATKNLVAAGAANRCELQIAYAIGIEEPVSIMINTFGTEKVDLGSIEKAIREVFDLRPEAIIKELDLLQPIYQPTAAYGHFGREDFPWEQLNKVKDLQSQLGI